MNVAQTYFNNVKPVTCEIEDVRNFEPIAISGKSFYNVNTQYLNGLPKSVTVVERTGLKVTLPPLFNPVLDDFIVIFNIEASNDVIFNIADLLNSSGCHCKVVADAVRENRRERGVTHYSLYYHIPLDKIESNNGSIYIPSLDKVFSTLNEEHVPSHPHSELGYRSSLIVENETINDTGSFGYSIRIIDNDRKYGHRFVNINNSVFRIPSCENPSMPDGVYLASSAPVNGDHDTSKPYSKRFDFETADEELKLFKTYAEAKNLGDVFAQKEQELKEQAILIKEKEQKLKNEKLEKEHEYDLLKQNIERERTAEEIRRKEQEAAITAKLNRLKEQQAELDHVRTMEMISRKSNYEERSIERKDSSEMVKFIPTIIAGALAVFIAFSKIFA